MQEPTIVRDPLSKEVWERIAHEGFGDLAKIVVDVHRGILAIGGNLHADGERVLLEDGSRQEDLWGANIYPTAPTDQRLAYESLINIRPSRGNRSVEIQDDGVRRKLRSIVDRLLL